MEVVAVKLAVEPAQTVELLGFPVMTGVVVTVRVAAALATFDWQTLVKRARNWWLLSAAVTVNVYVVEVAPAMSLKVVPPSVESCHCTVGLGLPEAAAVKLALVPLQAVVFVGSVVTTGGVLTVSVAAVVFVEPQTSVKTARYWLLLSAPVAVNESVVEVAPGTLLNVVPPSVETCHCTV